GGGARGALGFELLPECCSCEPAPEFCEPGSDGLKLIGRALPGKISKLGFVVDPFCPLKAGPCIDCRPTEYVWSTPCWMALSCAICAGLFATWLMLSSDELLRRRAHVTPGSSTWIRRGTVSLVVSSKLPCGSPL